MDYETTTAMDELEQLIAEKREKYKDVKEMAGFLKDLDDIFAQTSLRILVGDVDADYFKAVSEDVKLQEYHHLGEARLLPPDEQEARDKLRAFLLGPCDLPDDVR